MIYGVGKFTFVLENLVCFHDLLFGLHSGTTFSGMLDNNKTNNRNKKNYLSKGKISKKVSTGSLF